MSDDNHFCLLSRPHEDGDLSRWTQTQTDIIRSFDADTTIVAARRNEQGQFYNNGLLKVPNGVCKMFADDRRGFVRDKGDGSNLDLGDGFYYHVMLQMNT